MLSGLPVLCLAILCTTVPAPCARFAARGGRGPPDGAAPGWLVDMCAWHFPFIIISFLQKSVRNICLPACTVMIQPKKKIWAFIYGVFQYQYGHPTMSWPGHLLCAITNPMVVQALYMVIAFLYTLHLLFLNISTLCIPPFW